MKNNLLLLLLMLWAASLPGFAQFGYPVHKPVPAAALPFQDYNNLVLLDVVVNGKGPFTFILDTGTKGSSIFAPLAAHLDLDYRKVVRYEKSRDSLQYGKAKSVMYQLNTVQFPAKQCWLLSKDDAVEQALGVTVHGVLGSDIFNEFVVEIDHDADSIRLYDPKTYAYQGPGHPIDITFRKQIPATKVLITPTRGAEPEEVKLLIHTGWTGTVGLEYKFMERWVGFDAFKSYYFHYRMLLPGHRIPMRTVIAEKLEMWGVRMQETPLYLSRKEKALTPGYWFIQGVMGNEMMRRFNLVFDYSRNVVYAARNTHAGKPLSVSRSGLELKASEDLQHVYVDKVHRYSPAAEIDIQEGDEVIGLYDIPMEDLTLSELRSTLMDGNRTIILYVQRGKVIYKKTFRLRAIL